ncbi:MAG: ribonuclease P [Candidatus Bathyarchaeota archaeon]|nr:ribonuclease P [Candidatus Bathyarchaeota archaeon]
MTGKDRIISVALSRIKRLFNLAVEALNERPELSQEYIEIARRIAMRARTHLPKEYRLLTCRHCKRFIFPGVGSRVRLQPKREPHIVITCLYCGKFMRIPLKRSKYAEERLK